MNQPRHVLLIGASSDIGGALAAELQTAGIVVSGAGRTLPTSTVFPHFFPILYQNLSWPDLLARISREVGTPIDAVAFLPGVASFGATADIPITEAREIFEVNFWLLSQAALGCASYWREQKIPGTFVGLLSIAALRAIPDESYYAASKSAALRFLETLDLEYAADGQSFRAACPGLFASKFRKTSTNHNISAPDLAATSLEHVAHAVKELLFHERQNRVIGWRENVIALADRVSPHIYNFAMLRGRLSKRPRTP
jgi:short-subunit dehydrogenase